MGEVAQALQGELVVGRGEVFVEVVEHEEGRPADERQGDAQQQPLGGVQVADLDARLEAEAHGFERRRDVAAPAPAPVQGKLGLDLVGDREGLVELVDAGGLAKAYQTAGALPG